MYQGEDVFWELAINQGRVVRKVDTADQGLF